jgi:hypothetical protein
MQGYPVFRVPTVAPGPTPGRGYVLVGGAIIYSRAALLNFVPCDFEAVVQPC